MGKKEDAIEVGGTVAQACANTRFRVRLETLYHSIVPLVVVLTLAASPATTTLAQDASADTKPALILSIASIDRLLGDIGYLTRAAGTPQVGGLLTLMAGPYLEGLDTKKPVGLLVTFNGTEPAGVAFVPVADFKAVLNKLTEQLGQPEDLGAGLKKLDLERDIYFKEQGGWIFVAEKAGNLARLPRDPSRHLEGLEQKYVIAAQVNGRSIPEPLKEVTARKWKKDLERQLESQLANAPEKDRELAENIQRHLLAQLASFVEQADQLTVGWGVDRNSKKIHLDCNVIAREGTRLAQRIAQSATNRSKFSGFLLPEAAVTLHFTTAISPEDIEQAVALLGEFQQRGLSQIDNDPGLRDKTARETVREAFGLLMSVLQATIREGEASGGAAVVLSPSIVQFVAGGRTANGADVEQAFRKLVDVAKDDPSFPVVAFDAESYKTVDLHTLSFPIPASQERARKLLGDRLDVVLGTGPDRIYLALGKDCVVLLKKVIDSSADRASATVLPMRLRIAVAPIFEFAASLEDNLALSTMAAGLTQSEGRDNISVTAQTVDRSILYRLEIDEGVLRIIGQGAQLPGANGGN